MVTYTFDWNHLYFAYRSEKFDMGDMGDMGGLNSFPYQTVTCNQNETKTAEPQPALDIPKYHQDFQWVRVLCLNGGNDIFD